MTTREQLRETIRRTEDLRQRRRAAIAQLTAQWDEENDFAQRDADNRTQLKALVKQDSGETGRMINLALVDYPYVG